MKKTVRNNVHRFAEESTIHGVNELWNFGIFGKLCWLGIMVAVFLWCAVQLNDLVSDFLSDPKTTSITEVDSIPYPVMIVYLGDIKSRLNASKLPVEYHYDRNLTNELEDLLEKYLFKPAKTNYMSCPLNKTEAIKDRIRDSYSNLDSFNLSDPKELKYLHGVLGKAADGLSTIFNNQEKNITQMYMNFLRNDAKDMVAVTIEKDRPFNLMPHHVTLDAAPYGLRYSFKLPTEGYLVNANVLAKSTRTHVQVRCSENERVSWGIGSEYRMTDVRSDTPDLTCNNTWRMRVTLRLNVYHERYCEKNIQSLCYTNCLIRSARETKTCLQYLGVPHLRRDIPFCGFQSWTCNSDHIRKCLDECRSCAKCRPCSSVSMVRHSIMHHVPPWVDEGVAKIGVTVEVGTGYERIHLVPKYSMANLFSGVGGIIGIGFGISIMSIMQIGVLMLRLCRDGIHGRENSIKSNTEERNGGEFDLRRV